ncbi:hypothetical protein [Nocardia sp. NPDC052566]|uniref:hypothetical protein n=1 Tax=Nocardia sp. NPDC052566 TaxID=3364330 RepID=UPI0037C5C4D8
MAITYENARELVRARLEPNWIHGTFCLDDREIVENDEFYVFNVGAREYLVGGDADFRIAGGVPVVYKDTGELGSLASVVVATDPSVRVRPNPSPMFDSAKRSE